MNFFIKSLEKIPNKNLNKTLEMNGFDQNTKPIENELITHSRDKILLE